MFPRNRITLVAIAGIAFAIAYLAPPPGPQRIEVTVHFDQPIQVQLVPAK
jgi:hypothetical protein